MLRKLLFFLLVSLAVYAFAAYATGTKAWYQGVGGSLSDTTGQFGDMVLSGGTAPAVTSPFVGWGPYAAAAKHSLPAALLTAMDSATAYDIHFDYMDFTSLPGNMFPFSAENGANDDYCNIFGTAGTAVFRWVSSSGGTNILDTTTTTAQAQVGPIYSVDFWTDGTNKRIYVNGVQAATVAHAANFPIAAAGFHFGAAWPPSSTFAFNGHIGGMRLLLGNVTIPVVDPVGNGQRTPFWDLRQRNFQTPPNIFY